MNSEMSILSQVEINDILKNIKNILKEEKDQF